MKSSEKSYHHGDLRRSLLKVAFEMLGEEAGWQFTMRELARRAGVTHAAPYKHFESKADLLAELAVEGFVRLTAALVATQHDGHASPREGFVTMCKAYVAFGGNNINLYRLMWSGDARASGNPRVLAHANAAFAFLLDRITRGQHSGWLASRNPAGQAVACWTQLHGLTLLSADGLLESLTANAIDVAIAELLDGLQAPRS